MNAPRIGPAVRWAEIIAVGSELLVPPRLDTNSLFITERLNEYGIEVRAKAIVGDRPADLEAVLRAALARTDLVVLCGGLGPTDDDLTREAVSAVTGRALREQPELLEGIRRRFAARGARMPEINRRQAMVPEGADVLPNGFGTAPGLWLEHDGHVLLLLPGPPAELKPMLERVVADRLAPMAGAGRLFRRVLRICGRTESEVDEMRRAGVLALGGGTPASHHDRAHLAGAGRTPPVAARAVGCRCRHPARRGRLGHGGAVRRGPLQRGRPRHRGRGR